MAILSNQATLDVPPLDLHPMMVKDVQKCRGSLDYSSDVDYERESSRGRYSNGQNISFHLHQDPHNSRRRYHSSSPPNSPIRRPHDVSTRTSKRSPFSSPSIRHISLSEYISWHVSKAPEDAETYFEALAVLQSSHIKLHQLGLVTESQWEAFGIPWGIHTSLTSEIHIFKAEKGLGMVHHYFATLI